MNPGQYPAVPLAFLNALRQDLLRQLLSRYREPLQRLGIAFEDGPPTERWLGSLHKAMMLEASLVPPILQTRLLDVLDLTCERGQCALHEVARQHGVDLDAERKLANPQDLALFTYLQYPEVFLAAHTQLEPCLGLWTANYCGQRGQHAQHTTSAEPPSLDVILSRRAAVLKRLSRRTPRITNIAVHEFQDEFVFLFSLDGTAARRDTQPASEFTDAVVYDKHTDRLSVRAKDSKALELYRTTVGALVGGDRDYFQDESTYTALPLKQLGSAAFAVQNAGPIDRVALRHLKFTDECQIRHIAKAPATAELSSWFDALLSSGVLKQATIDAWSLRVSIRGQKQAVKVRVRPPNRLWVDRPDTLQTLRAFLSANGFISNSVLGDVA